MIRHFYIQNAAGQTYDMNDPDTFGYKPQGLGLQITNAYINYNSDYIQIDRTLNQGQFVLNVIYGGGGGSQYQLYSGFVKFLLKPPYTLIYATDAGTFRRDCVLSEITKSELNNLNVLDEGLKIDFITPWYSIISLSSKAGGGSDFAVGYYGKTYAAPLLAYTYAEPLMAYTYLDYQGGHGSGGNSLQIVNRSQTFDNVASPCKITIKGPVRNPSWVVFQDSTPAASDGYFLDVPDGYTLEVSSFPGNQYCRLIDSTGRGEDIYQIQDMTRSNFVQIPLGNSTIEFSDDFDVLIQHREDRLIV